MNYFAVEIRTEPDQVLVETVLRSAHGLGLKFAKVEVMNRFTLGATKFLRFKTTGDVGKLLDRLYDDGRSVIGAEGTGFVARLKDRKGVAPTTVMLAVANTSLVYRGPGAPYWERQFQPLD